jgi:hypothetical protein
MGKGISVLLRGTCADEVAAVLSRRLAELGRSVELVDAVRAESLGMAAAHVCGRLSRDGAIVVATYTGPTPDGECLDITLSPHDTPDFAAEKVIDALAEAGVVQVAGSEYSPQHEEQIRKRLADLGYIE